MFKNKKIFLVIVAVFALVYFVVGGNNKQSVSLEDIIRIAVGGEPESLDLQLASGTWTSFILYDSFTGLFTKNAKGELVPDLAESWTVSQDGTIYEFKIKDNAKWSDGVDLTADDFVYSFQRAVDPKTAGKWGSYLYSIKGAEEFASGEGNKDEMHVKAVDKKTLRVELKTPVGYFLEMLSHYAYFPVPKHVIEKHGKKWTKVENIVGSGAYKISEYKLGSYVKAVKNEYYYDAKNVAIDNVIYYLQSDGTALTQRFRNEEIDILRSGVPADQYLSLKEQYGDEVVRVAPQLALYFYAINLNKVTDNRVREAMNLALDRDFIVNKVLAVKNVPAYSVTPEGFPSYKTYTYSWAKNSYKDNLKTAKELMEKAGYSKDNMLTLELSYNTLEDHKKIAVAVADMYKNIYINLKLVNTDVNTHYANVRNGDYELARVGWVLDYADPAGMLDIFASHSENNFSQYHNASYDKKLVQALKVVDQNARYRIYRTLEKQILDDNAIIPIYTYTSKNLVSKRVLGWEDNLADIHVTKYLKLNN